MIKAVIFDFDGVILESAGIKTRAFKKLFEQDYPEKVNGIIRYHKRNMGISRFVKFRHIYENILKMPLTIEEEKSLGRKFSEIVFEEIINAPFVAGAEEFIANNQRKYMMFIVSGTPEEELRDILNRRKISNFFKEVYGTPTSKPEIISMILERYSLSRKETVFVGDATNDLYAARENGIYFIARLNSENSELMNDQKWKIEDLKFLELLLRNIEQE